MFGLSADLIHRGIDSDYLKKISHELSPGRSAVIANISEAKNLAIGDRIEGLGGKVLSSQGNGL